MAFAPSRPAYDTDPVAFRRALATTARTLLRTLHAHPNLSTARLLTHVQSPSVSSSLVRAALWHLLHRHQVVLTDDYHLLAP
jgi:hypothetical protein